MNEKDSALVLAAENGQTETVKALLAAGAHVHADEDAALRRAENSGHADTVRVLKEWMARGEQESGL